MSEKKHFISFISGCDWEYKLCGYTMTTALPLHYTNIIVYSGTTITTWHTDGEKQDVKAISLRLSQSNWHFRIHFIFYFAVAVVGGRSLFVRVHVCVSVTLTKYLRWATQLKSYNWTVDPLHFDRFKCRLFVAFCSSDSQFFTCYQNGERQRQKKKNSTLLIFHVITFNVQQKISQQKT